MIADASHQNDRRNPVHPFDPDVLTREVNAHAVRRAADWAARPLNLDRDAQVAGLVHAVRCIDLTTLAGDDTAGRVRRLCAKARQPLSPDLTAALGVPDLTTGAVCVYPAMVGPAVAALEGSNIPVASVATGFPAGQTPLATRLDEIRYCVAHGAAEIDIVIAREAALTQDWARLYDEVAAMREACGPAHLKAILATGELLCPTLIHRASMIAMQAGADVIKTSTGKEPVNATLPVSLVMLRAVNEHARTTGAHVGFKPAGGLRSAADALTWQRLVAEQVGAHALAPSYFRIGASSLLGAIEVALETLAWGAPGPASGRAIG